MDGRWSISGLASMGAHGALVVGSLWWGAQHPAAVRASSVTELEVRSAPAAIAPAPAPTAQPVASAVPAQPRRARRFRPPPVPVPTSREEPAPTPEPAMPEGDEDHTLDLPSPSTLAAVHVAPPAPVAPLAPPAPPTVTALEASYLCTHQKLRSLPKTLDVRGRTYKVQVQACISAEGRVERLTLQKGAAPELDWQVLADMRAWRYRPRLVQGKPSPFCYKVRVSYEVQ